jgi:UDP-N-acetylmuramyl pentapeptide phosphotransferase/UDP-N-acetylglucosamine-1-phosphate transferase
VRTLFIYLLPTQLPDIDLPLVSKILDFGPIKQIFFIFSIMVIINGNNLIDGVNGNLSFSNTFQLISIALLAMIVGDNVILQLVFILLIPLLVFTFFNFPFGKIFCGDAGAYLYGFAISGSIISLFGNNVALFSWSAILILLYPSLELLFSFIRKMILENGSPFEADAKHLHSLLFKFLNKRESKFNNSLVAMYLFPLTITPILSYFFYSDLFATLFTIISLCVLYVFINLFLLKKLHSN